MTAEKAQQKETARTQSNQGWKMPSLAEMTALRAKWAAEESAAQSAPASQPVVDLIHVTRPGFQDEFRAGEVFQAKGQTLIIVTCKNNVFYAEDGWSFGVQAESGKAHSAECRPATDEESAVWEARRAEDKAAFAAHFTRPVSSPVASEEEDPFADKPVFTKTSAIGHKIKVTGSNKTGFAVFVNDKKVADKCWPKKLAKPLGAATHTIGDAPAVGLTAAEFASFSNATF